jgi:hypothetical protein
MAAAELSRRRWRWRSVALFAEAASARVAGAVFAASLLAASPSVRRPEPGPEGDAINVSPFP